MPNIFSSTVLFSASLSTTTKSPSFYLSLSLTFPPFTTPCSTRPSIHPLPDSKPALQFNSPSVDCLRYQSRDEIRDPEYRGRRFNKEGEGLQGSPSQAEVTYLGLAKTQLPPHLPGSPPEVAGLNICPLPLSASGDVLSC